MQETQVQEINVPESQPKQRKVNWLLVLIPSVIVAVGLIVGAYFVGVESGKSQAQADQSAQNAFLQSRGFDPGNLPGATGGTGNGTGRTFPGGGQGALGGRGAAGTVQKVEGNTV